MYSERHDHNLLVSKEESKDRTAIGGVEIGQDMVIFK